MSIFGLKAHLELLNLYKIGNPHKHFNSHVIKFISVTLSSKSIENKRETFKYFCAVIYTTLALFCMLLSLIMSCATCWG
jgi:hypothetical protein